jgi:hypothetical protein
MLLQEWARLYDELPHVPSEPNHRALVHLRLSLGLERYGIRHAAQLCFTLLHISILLWLGAFSLVLHKFSEKVASAADSFIGLFVLAYTGISAIACLSLRIPCRTPMSYVLWYPCHGFISLASFGLYCFVGQFHGCILRFTSNASVAGLRRRLENISKIHWKYFLDNLGTSALKHALHAEGLGEREIVISLFNSLALGDETKYRKFAANLPRDRVRDLVPSVESERIILKEPLSILLRSCVAGTRVAGPDDSDSEEMRKRALLLCLEAIQYIAMEPTIPDLDSVWATFANIDLMQELWADSDMAIRVTSRSICALLARHLVKE